MRHLLIYLRDYKKESILGPLFKLLEASFELLVPLVVAAMIDTGIANSDKGFIIRWSILLAALGLIGLLCSVTAQYFAAKAAVGFSARLRHALFAHIQSLPFDEIDEIGTSTLITRMTSDSNQVQAGINLVLRLFLRSPFIVFGAMVMAFTIDVPAAMLFVILIPLLFLAVFGIILVTIPLYRKVQEKLDRVLQHTGENLAGVRVIRAFRQEKAEMDKFQESSKILQQVQMQVGRISGLMNPVTVVMVNGFIIALLYTGTLRVEAGLLTPGAVIALVNYMSQILVELVKLANLIITVTKAVASGNRIQAVFEKQSALRPVSQQKKTSHRHFIEFDHVSLRYKNAAAESLTDINFTADRGQTIGIIGGTGSGKSSLVHLIPRFYDVEKGSITVDGKDVREYDLEEIRSKVGIAMQQPVLFRGTIRDNLLWGNEKASSGELWEALRTAQAEEFVQAAEKGLDSYIEQGGRNLSGGQRQRLTIARALVKKPEILILDDSASALDYATEAGLRTALSKIKDNTVVFIVSQRASSILHADKILVLEDGTAAGIGTHEELLARCEVYREIYASQFEQKGT